MTPNEYYGILAERWSKVNKNSQKQIKEYNEWKRQMREQYYDQIHEEYVRGVRCTYHENNSCNG